tara:strand:- start:2756 stop:4120 length:1365 start_codon:yes stop_codon:yes gene_type:complete
VSSLKFKPTVVWFTGLSGAGKTTLSQGVATLLREQSVPVVTLDGDELRAGPCRDLGFTPQDRAENVRRAAVLASEQSQSGQIVLVALISPMRADRDIARHIIEGGGAAFVEIFVDAPLSVAEARDPKGLYKRARRGELRHFTGVDAPYEAPIAPTLAIRTDAESPEQSASRVMEILLVKGVKGTEGFSVLNPSVPFNFQLLEDLIAVARRAGDVIMDIYATDFAVEEKRDDSPVTAADERAEAVITAALRQMTPDIPIVAEEAMAAGKQVSPGRQFWLVDPLDGTKEFVSRNGEFTVNIALISDGVPVLGVVYAPVTDTVFAGSEDDGAYIVDAGAKRAISVRNIPDAGAVVLTSRSHGDYEVLHKRLEGQTIADWRLVGSSLKICLIAAGEGDLYPRLGRTMEWDTAAGHAVLRAAGGRLMVLEGAVVDTLQAGRELGYGKPGFENPNFLACA